MKPPHIIEYTLNGKGGDIFRVDMQQQEDITDIHLLKIAFHLCFTACQFSINTTTQIITIITQVPHIHLIQYPNLWKVPIYLTLTKNQSILDSWLIGYFSYNETTKPSRSSSDIFYTMPYIGLPPTEPSTRSMDYFQNSFMTSFQTTDLLSRPSVLVAEPSYARPIQALSTQSSSTSSMDPFVHMVHKPNLIIQGDLTSLVFDWTEEEQRNQRRLVQFWRHQEDNNIFCRFAPYYHSQEEEDVIIVSCICWHGEFYITSVDCIMLLERLINVKFTVEEKNRIRRNLEEYKPITVSKTANMAFFKLVMSYSRPKPRSIEKGVKLFPWHTLSEALKKIVHKYTASYSSTVPLSS